MPRKRPKTEADRPNYRTPAMPPLAVPEHLEPFLAGVELRRIVEKYGVANVELIVGVMAEQARREMIAHRSRETLDLMKANVRPAQTALTVDKQPTRANQLEDGVAHILATEPDSWQRRQLVEIADGVQAGKTLAEVAQEVGVRLRTAERRVAYLKKAAAEMEALTKACSECGQNGGGGAGNQLDF